jgi:hypothetical protein
MFKNSLLVEYTRGEEKKKQRWIVSLATWGYPYIEVWYLGAMFLP